MKMVCLGRKRNLLLSSFFFLSINCYENLGNLQYFDDYMRYGPNDYPTSYYVMNEMDPIASNTMSEQIVKASLLLGGAVLLTAIGIFGSTDFDKFKREKKMISEVESTRFDELEKRLREMEERIEELEGNRRNIDIFRLICIFANQLGDNNFRPVNCDLIMDITTGDLCNAVNQVIRRINSIESPTFCHGFGFGSGSFGSIANVGARVSAVVELSHRIQPVKRLVQVVITIIHDKRKQENNKSRLP